MPVKVSKRGGTFRIVNRQGRVEKSKNKKPLDGGGHGSLAKARRQARAINRRSR